MRTNKKIFFLGFAVFSFLFLSNATFPGIASSNSTPEVYDDFNDDYLSTTRWSSFATSETTVQEVSGQLEMGISQFAEGTSITSGVDSYCWFNDDFDIETEYNLISWPYASGVRLGLSVRNGINSTVIIRASLSSNASDLPGAPREIYVMDYSPSPNLAGLIETDDQTGKLRLKRTGTQLTGYYHDESSGWVELASYENTAVEGDPVRFRLNIWSNGQLFTPDSQNIEVAFDNVIVNDGQLICPVKVVSIDIKPGSYPNSINLCSNGAVPIALLGSDTFNVNNVNTETLRFAEAAVKVVGKKDPHSLCSYSDINGDLIDDLVCHFVTADIAGIDGESTSATVNGEFIDGTPIEGTDNFNIVKDTCQ
jgi:hypothetical protein